ncbi:MAG: ABC transporter permease [Anaerolineales bacterium]|nr:ABC transporter permease [Anaerolineales bacterium]MBP6208049.1 ABC transporter permease [Anaerolineales bacterium]MBP8164374.1 ABC transporter permease [Anaerolineales bacterium]
MNEQSMARIITRRFFKHTLAGIAVGVLLLMVLASVFAFASPYSPTDQEPTNSFQKSSIDHWFGTDELGRDIFTRILYGGRVSLAVGLLSTFLSIAVGVVVGALSGYFGGWTDSILMRITDAFLTFPTIFVLIILGAFLREQQVPWLKNSVIIVVLIIAAMSWMWPARLVRGLFLVLREREFVTASRALGGNHLRIIVQHILPNCIGPILVSGTLQMASAIITESGLSYLGFGVQPPTPTWGSILATAQNQVFRAPWVAFYPGLMIFITVMTINYIGDGLRDAFDPYVVHKEK